MSAAPSPATRLHRLAAPLALEGGGLLDEIQVAYRTWGELSPAGDNAVLVCHALTGSADADDWWGGLFGPGAALDPARDFVVCSNVLGSCYGTTGPSSPKPEVPASRQGPELSAERGIHRTAPAGSYGPDFPDLAIRDLVHVQARLLEELGVRRLKLVLGGSLGGMQVLEWALLYPDRVEAIAPIAVSGRHSPWCIGLSEAQRQALCTDPLWQGGHYLPEAPPAAGLAAARALALCTYRSPASFSARFGRRHVADAAMFEVESYLRYQGRKLVERFDANSYLTLTKAMDRHDLGRGRGSYEQALTAIGQPALVVSIDSDVLYPPEEQRELAQGIPNARLVTLSSPHGHDAFLIEIEALNRLLIDFRQELAAPRRSRLPLVEGASATGEEPDPRGEHAARVGEQQPQEPSAAQQRPAAPGAARRAAAGLLPHLATPAASRVPPRVQARRVDAVLIGATGRVGAALAHQLQAVQAQLAAAPQVAVDLRLVGALNRRRMAWSDTGLDPLEIDAALRSGDPTDWLTVLERLHDWDEHPLIAIDCTASGEVADLYAQLLGRGIAVVTPNKRANSRSLESWEHLRSLAATVPFRYETNVGAALPLLGTLADLKRAGDRLRSVSAVLSGTLAFVLHRLEEGAKLSAAVREAHALGYTEPHPREDLSGQDVARKLLILLREAGFPYEPEDLTVEPLVPADFLAEDDPETFLASLTALDPLWAERTASARARGQRLFYLASFHGIDPRVGVAALPSDHRIGKATPGENIVVYSTDRYPKLPLTISGPGAGPEITATGVLNDLIGAARELAWRAPRAAAREAKGITAPRYAAAHQRPVLFVV